MAPVDSGSGPALDAPTLVAIHAFGPWSVRVNGEAVGAIKSRYSRELLLRFSLDAGPVARDLLIDQLRPDAPDHRTARRRLTRELSRLQAALGITLWSTTPDLVGVADDVTIESDAAVVADHHGSGHTSGDRNRQAWELGKLLTRFDAGPLLPGHDSEWALQLRARLGVQEAELRHQLLGLLAPVDATDLLRHARRLLELNPFDDRAHVAMVRALRGSQSLVAAQAHVDEIESLYRRELNGAPVPHAVHLALAEPPRAAPVLHAQIASLRSDYDAASGDERLAIAVRLDDALRAAGHHEARCAIAGSLPAWREAELLLVRGQPLEAEQRLVDADQAAVAGDDHPGWTALTWALLHHMQGRNTQAREILETLLGETLPPDLEIEANVRLERVLDAHGDIDGSRRCCFTALDLARKEGDLAARAAATTALGWSLSRSYRFAEATTTLEQAMDLAEASGADAVRATGFGGIGHLAYWGRRHGTAAAHMQAAAAIARRNGDLAALVRWLLNEVPPQSTIGDFDRLEALHAELQTMPEGLMSPPAHARLLELEARLAQRDGDAERVFELRASLHEHFTATGEHLPMLSNLNATVDIQLDLGLSTDALELAEANLAQALELTVPPIWEQILRMRVGAAQVVSGDLEGGVAALAEAIEHGEPAQILSPTCYAIYYDALQALGRDEDAALVRRSVRHMLRAFRHDLTADQWRIARRQSPYVVPLLRIAGDDDL